MRIGIDVDDTITNTYECLVEKIAEYYKVDGDELLDRALTYDVFNNSEEFPCFSNFVEKYFDVLAPNFPIKDDAKEYLDKIYAEGNEIIFITARHIGEYTDPYALTFNYLIKNTIPFDKIIVGSLDKGRTCLEENIDLFIDDSIGNCNKVKNCGINILLFNSRFNKKSDLRRVYSWHEIYDLIHNHKI